MPAGHRRYPGQGPLIDDVEAALRDRYPSALSTQEVSDAVARRRSGVRPSSISGLLQLLHERGKVTRLGRAEAGSIRAKSVWRWRQGE